MSQAGVIDLNCVQLESAHISGQSQRLLMPARRKLHVDATAEDTLVTCFNFSVTKQINSGERIHLVQIGKLSGKHRSRRAKGGLLRGEELPNAAFRQPEHRGKLRLRKRGFLTAALNFDKFTF